MLLLMSGAAQASGIYECESVERSKWLTEEQLTQQLVAGGWQEVRRMKPDGGCWEVYGTTPEGQRVEGYFDPVSGEQLLLAQRGRIIFRKEE
ncbi:MAG: PepSY domain-containing protein [Alphaproteobacteria bacterium]|nr:PepSY domain-containing protein [Alphaproteobacteria bacterium]